MFSVQGYDQNNNSVQGLVWIWSVTGGIGFLNSTSGQTVVFTATAEGSGSLNATATYGGISKSFCALVTVSKMMASVSISTSSSSTTVRFNVNITGRLTDEYGHGLAHETVVLHYALLGVSTWTLIATDATDTLGNYFAAWIPPATGDFTIEAEWAGNTTYSEAKDNVTLSCFSYNNQYILSVESNSTITDLAFDATNSVLSFTASGLNDTNGYAKVTVSKSLAGNITDVRVYIDGIQSEYTAASTDDSWLLSLNYTHSGHRVAVVVPEFPYIIMLLLLVAVMTLNVALERKYSGSRYARGSQNRN